MIRLVFRESDGITVERGFPVYQRFHENVLGFCNNIYNAEGGTHLTGFKTMFTTVMNNYARELGILKAKRQQVLPVWISEMV